LITENLSTLKIHKLTQAQYNRELDAGRIDENALYLTPDESASLKGLLANEDMVLSSRQYGDELPAAGITGRIFFKKVSG
jgi:hypothetical protein